MIHQNNRHHRFSNRDGADTHARVMATFGDHLHLLAFAIDGTSWHSNARRRFQRKVSNHRLTTADTAENATRMVTFEALRSDFIAVFAATLVNHGKAVANLHAF